MKRLLIISFLISINSVYASDHERAAKHIQKAILAYPEVKDKIKSFRNYAFRKTGISKEHLKYAAMLAPFAQQKITTTKFKNLRWRGENFNLRPDVTYDMRDGSLNTQVNFTLSFE